MIRIFFGYKHVEGPWGGANNFIRALHDFLATSGRFAFVDDIEAPCDLIFMNQLGTGPGGEGSRWPIRRIRRLLAARSARPQLIVRAVNLNSHAFNRGLRNRIIGRWQDRDTVALLNMADVAIFQSQYQQSFFAGAGFNGPCEIVHNGADSAFQSAPLAARPLEATLRLVSSTASPRASKRHDLIARFAEVEGVEVVHMGAWPQGQDPGKVRLLGKLARDEMIAVLSEGHYFLHPAIKDPCPNVVFEALSSGLPVIYNAGIGSSTEIVGSCGVPLDEDDVAATVTRARAALDVLREDVRRQRAHFGIGRAAAQYARIFEETARRAGRAAGEESQAGAL